MEFNEQPKNYKKIDHNAAVQAQLPKPIPDKEKYIDINLGAGIHVYSPGDPETLSDGTKGYLADPWAGPIGH